MPNNKTLIILDTNFLKEGNQNNKIYSTLSSRSDFQEFLAFLEKNNLKKKIIFGIPDITFEEHFYHKNNDFNSDLDYLKEKITQFNKMEILEDGKLDLKFKDSFNYKNFLKEFIETNDSFVFFELPDNKKKDIFEKVLKKSINHEKPFHKRGDRNFKDALIWECICCQDFSDYAWVIFLTQNEDDFPKNNDLDEINQASEKTGKIIHILYKYNDLKKELEKIYMFMEKEIKEYILEYFKERMKEDAEGHMDCILETFNLIEKSIKIEKLKNSDLEDIQMLEDWGNKDNVWIINFEFEADCIDDEGREHRKFLGKIYFDNNVKDIIWSEYGNAEI